MVAIITDKRTHVLYLLILSVFGDMDNIDTYKIHTTQVCENSLSDEK